jgi:ATP synthase protein I
VTRDPAVDPADRAPPAEADRHDGGAAPRGDEGRPREELLDTVKRKEARKQRARREGEHGLAFGLGLFGLVGWSVAIPTLIGIGLGVWIDTRSEGPYSWTLMLMLIGVIVGCLNAWYWVRKEMHRD